MIPILKENTEHTSPSCNSTLHPDVTQLIAQLSVTQLITQL